jgi:peptidoglycan/xylan/chitin deacetylase (PgdA/CDA1 family)
VAVVSGASALLLTAVALKVAELVEVGADAGRRTTAEVVVEQPLKARLVEDDYGPRVRVEGEAGTRILVMRAGRPLQVVTVGDEGHGQTRILELEDRESTIELVPMDNAGLTIAVPAAPTPTPTETPAPDPTATPRLQRIAGPTPSRSPPVLQLVDDAGSMIAITFDGNASSNRTDELLDLLHELDLEVTLFVTGRFIEKNPSVVRRAVLAGHEFANHTFSHPRLTTYAQNRRHDLHRGMTRTRLQRELKRTEDAFRKATGRSMQPLWRAPYGEENRVLRGWALEAGYLHVRWSSLRGASLDTRDWVDDEHSSLYQNSRAMMERLLRFPMLEGGIILMHLATERKEAPWTELPSFVEALRQRGLRPTKVSELIEASPRWAPWFERARTNHEKTYGD